MRLNLKPYVSLPLLLFLTIFLIFSLKFVKIIVNPKLDITSPKSELVFEKEIILSGRIDPLSQLRVNGEQITLREDGTFERKAILKEGLNEFNFQVKNFWGVEKSKKLKVIYLSK